MPEREYSHDPHIWPITLKYPVTADEIDHVANALLIWAELVLERLETEVTAPPKPKPEPEGDADDLPDAT